MSQATKRMKCTCERAIRINSFVAAYALSELSKVNRPAVDEILAEVERKYGERKVESISIIKSKTPSV